MQYLFNDEWIDHRAGVRRVPGSPCKLPAPVLRPEAPWELNGIQGHHALFFDEEEQTFKHWYRSTLEGETTRTFICYAESSDGLEWHRPSLGLIDFNGSSDNNILMEWDEGDSMLWNVVKDTHEEDPNRRYKAIGFDRTEEHLVEPVKPGRNKGVCIGFSADGLRWSVPQLVMNTNDMTDSDNLLGQRDPTTGKWVAYFRPLTHPKRRFIGYSESDDFIHWSYPRMLLTPDSNDAEWLEFYGLTVAQMAQSQVGLLWVYHNNPDYSPMTVELVYSPDGRSFFRPMPGVEFLPLGPDGDFDSRMIIPIALIERGNEYLLFYNGRNSEHGSDRGMPMQRGKRVEDENPQSGVGLARIAGKKFCGLRADMDGLVETKWLCNYGDAGIVAEVDIDEGGWIKAEVCDQFGEVLPGWDRSCCEVELKGYGLMHFSWGERSLAGKFDQVSEAGGRIGHVVKVRFHLHKATLFGFHVGAEDSHPRWK